MDADWQINPQRGIGRLTFGLSAGEVSAMAAVYGKPSRLMSQAHVLADLEAVLVQCDPPLPAEDVASMLVDAKALANLATQTLSGSGAILLDYRDDRLDSIAVEARHARAHFEGRLIFALAAEEALALLESANGAPGRYRGEEAAFDNLAISLHSFSSASRDQARAMPATQADFHERSVTVRKEAYRPAGELSQFTIHSFL